MKTRSGIFAAAMLAATLAVADPGWARQDRPAAEAQDLSHLHDFDFLRGDWTAHHRKLRARLAGSTDWVAFDGAVNQRPVMGGWGNSGDNVFNVPGAPYRGVSLRAYDPKTAEWLVWWLDGRDPTGALGPPIRGRFENGVGHFYSNDTEGGKPIRVRVTWTRPGPDRARWEQAFSTDGGKTWEVNWTTDFTRARPPVAERRASR